jgi:hypothetical protein
MSKIERHHKLVAKGILCHGNGDKKMSKLPKILFGQHPLTITLNLI